jgi:anti-anti-sigma factor
MSQPAALDSYPTSWREEATSRLTVALSDGGDVTTLREANRPQPSTFEAVLRGEIDLSALAELDALHDQFLAGDYAVAEVDLRAVTYFDSTGLSFLARLGSSASQRGGTLTLVCPSSPCLRLLKIVKMDEVFPIRPGSPQAKTADV